MKYIPGIMVLLALMAMMFYAVVSGLSAEQWYTDKHDSKCEKLTGKSNCGCYDRFMKKGN